MIIVKKKIDTTPALILILAAIVLTGCSANPDADVAKTGNKNQASATPIGDANKVSPASNNDSSQIPTASVNSNVLVNPPINPPTAVSNASTPAAGKDKKTSSAVKEPEPQIGSGGNDLFLFAQARTAISSDAELLNAVIIEIKEGNATLTGNVSSAVQKNKAGQLIQSVKGIKSVKNNLRVVS